MNGNLIRSSSHIREEFPVDNQISCFFSLLIYKTKLVCIAAVFSKLCYQPSFLVPDGCVQCLFKYKGCFRIIPGEKNQQNISRSAADHIGFRRIFTVQNEMKKIAFLRLKNLLGSQNRIRFEFSSADCTDNRKIGFNQHFCPCRPRRRADIIYDCRHHQIFPSGMGIDNRL